MANKPTNCQTMHTMKNAQFAMQRFILCTRLSRDFAARNVAKIFRTIKRKQELTGNMINGKEKIWTIRMR